MASETPTQPTPPVTPSAPATTNNNGEGRGNAHGNNRSGERGSGGRRGRGNNGGRGNSNRENSNNRSTNQVQSTNPITFEGDNADVGAVLGLRIEKFHKKATFTIFKEKIYNYIIFNFKDGHDIRPLFKDGSDPIKTHKDKNKPAALGTTADEVYREIHKVEITQYVSRQANIKRNITKTFGLVWGQFSAALQSQIKGDAKWEEALDNHDTIWLIAKLKKAVSGINPKANTIMTLVKSVLALANTRQSGTESDNTFLERFKSTIATTELAGGKNVFCPTELKHKLNDLPDQQEIRVEEEKMKSAFLLNNVDGKRYSGLRQRLEEGMMLGRDEYPVTLAHTYELIVEQNKNPQKKNSNSDNNSHSTGRTGASFSQRGNSNDSDATNNEQMVGGRPVLAGND